MVDFKLAPIKRYAKLANNKASQQFISVTKTYPNRPWAMLHLFGEESVKQAAAAAAAASNKINSKGHAQKCQRQPERGVLRNLVLWKLLFHNVVSR